MSLLTNIWETYATVMICPPAIIFELARYFVYCNDLWQAETDKDNKVPEKRPLVDPPSPNFYVSALDFFCPPSILPTKRRTTTRLHQPSIPHPNLSFLFAKTHLAILCLRPQNIDTSAKVLRSAPHHLRSQPAVLYRPSVVLTLKAIEVFKDAFFFTPSVKAKTSRHTPSEETGTEDIGNIIPPDVHVNQLQDEAEPETPAGRDPTVNDKNKEMDLDEYDDDEENSEDERSLSPEESRLALET
ncbi:hypothetical protein B0H16DRAFT_1619116 [Mycena metata]|uniref:Uncharacterized protein n=1 Tax=Mycena metata TaxID=1033252 RepID=A0AAD7H7Y0_9AGAR|nr:hypothetical protein B0H16DRAFT_1619116 [Mycena metata]